MCGNFTDDKRRRNQFVYKCVNDKTEGLRDAILQVKYNIRHII